MSEPSSPVRLRGGHLGAMFEPSSRYSGVTLVYVGNPAPRLSHPQPLFSSFSPLLPFPATPSMSSGSNDNIPNYSGCHGFSEFQGVVNFPRYGHWPFSGTARV